MPALLALIPEIIEAIATFIGATWWQIPVAVGLWKLQDAASNLAPPPGQQTPVQSVVSGAGQAVSGVTAAVGGTGQAVGSFGQFISQNPWVVIAGLVAVFVLKR